jgi:outer membrane protein TolC
MPLDLTPHVARSVSDLKTDVAGTQLDVTKPLGIADVIYLALENNPELRADRFDHKVAEAAVIDAGLLPNPSITAGYAVFLGGPATSDAWNLGFTEDLKAILTRSPRVESARYALFKVDADSVWKEWELISKTSVLVVDAIMSEKLRVLLDEANRLFEQRSERSRRALAQGNIDMSAAAPDFSALSDIQKQVNDLAREQLSRRHDLNALLGLAPDAPLVLADSIDVPEIDAKEVDRMIVDLPHRRPDLVALQLGYRSQEAKLRAAVLAQFPALSFGPTYTSDTSMVKSFGPTLTIDLPIFNLNQGNIAAERATRAKLAQEFSDRYAAAIIEIEASVSEQALASRQLDELQAKLGDVTKSASEAESAYRTSSLDERGYVDLVMRRISTQQEINGAQRTILENRVKIASLLGAGLPALNYPVVEQEHSQ